MSWTLEQLAGWCDGSLEGDAQLRATGVSTDTRTLARGDVFVALRGESFDGHAFVAQAVRQGAAGVLVSEPPAASPGVPVLRVADTGLALGALAAGHRQTFAGPVVAITGSNGKTTTKELCAAILTRAGRRVRRTPGNLNNHIGLPLSVLRLRESDEVLVVELGMNHPGEIDALARIARPTVGAITNVAAAHLGPVGSLEAIAKAKGELFDQLQPEGTAVIARDDARVRAQAGRFAGRQLGFGRAVECEFRASDVRCDAGLSAFALDSPAGRTTIRFRVPGVHLVDDGLCAAAASWATGLLGAAALEAIRDGLEGFAGVPGRAGLRDAPGGLRVFDDSYNANPHSVRAALVSLQSLASGGRAAAVLGDMFELGADEAALHAECGVAAARAGVDLLVGVGPRSRHTCSAARAEGIARAIEVEEPRDAAREVRAWARPGDVVLVKGSRGMHMEAAVHALMETG